VTATDFHSQTGPVAAQTVSVTAAALQTDPIDSTKTALVVGGTTGGDIIIATPTNATGSIQVTINGRSQGVFQPTGHIIVYSQGGNDVISLRKKGTGSTAIPIQVPALLFGGGGNDTLDVRGSIANNVLVGGSGNSTLYGGGGRDILIGGGADHLYAGAGGSILIGGTTNFDSNPVALGALSAEWGRTDISYSARIADLMGTTTGGLNGTYYLNPSTVHDNNLVDVLYGAAGMDWFFAHQHGTNLDIVKNSKPGEVITPI
jgi:Ca2+-binding RTX toxin-like protein